MLLPTPEGGVDAAHPLKVKKTAACACFPSQGRRFAGFAALRPLFLPASSSDMPQKHAGGGACSFEDEAGKVQAGQLGLGAGAYSVSLLMPQHQLLPY